MSDILLIHGSCHGAWCWRDLIPALTALGHSPRAIDLPSHGQDTTPLSEVTLDSCAEAIVNALGENTVVLGHSWGGFPITRAADLSHARGQGHIARLIYLCAYAPWDGHALIDMRRAAPRQPLLHAVVKSDDGLSYTVDPAKTRAAFYHDCPTGTEDFANAHLSPQSIRAQSDKITLGEGQRLCPKSYIRCTDDQTIPPEFQVTMTESWPASDVYDMPTSHSPFFADPKGLAALIDRIVKAS
ncbi:alpha/beta fold hydrolase [Shimia marina]|uniref:Acetoin dehydrogenase E2 subunit dihydrolipoyllysine-residue acetyltransferase n=1 Tax=Shimia marina TaxID=321267 RepID=A0A0P1EU81_9RHOB|nr:alpha/beta fold hydrolase [Shimia marina]CUH54086.1 acetoin dehydrogenase E2 subunit dihydrolipoyllysine-residue acetyltransferase [Shimia marina]SFE60083.1 Pimeloyl-ACP methyl ester carboxylesterase [Shimia marina]